MADMQASSVQRTDEEQLLNEIKDQIDEHEQRTSVVNDILQTEIVKLTMESEMPIEDLRKLYTSSTNIATVSVTKPEESTSSEEDESTDDDDGGYQRLLIAEHPTLNENGEEEDADGSSFSFYWQKAINVGEQYQAVVPELQTTSDLNDQESPDDHLLWSPPLEANQEENAALVNKYLKLAAKEFRTADQETVLQVFLSTDYNIDPALEKLRLPITNKNFFLPTPWTLPECDQFEQCFRDYGKDFSMFKIPNRSANELVFFYYIWKKSARHDVFVRQYRVEKRRFHLHPYVTDYLEKFFVEQELQLTNAYEQNNSSSSALNPQLSGEQLLSKRRLSSDLFLKPMPAIKRTKPPIHPVDTEPLDATTTTEHSQAIRSSSPTLTKKLNDEVK